MKYGSLREKIASETAERRERYAKFEYVYKKAVAAGLEAGKAAKPRPMIVGTPTTLLGNDIDYSKPTYYESEGLCGFAWVVIFPATSSFARWLVKEGHVGRGRSYGGGTQIWISDHGQSYERKCAHAEAMVKVLNDELGIKACAGSRLD